MFPYFLGKAYLKKKQKIQAGTYVPDLWSHQ
jgi:hypothetical protein